MSWGILFPHPAFLQAVFQDLRNSRIGSPSPRWKINSDNRTAPADCFLSTLRELFRDSSTLLGVLVAAVEAGGPAAAVGIQSGDTILALDGRLMKGRSFESAVASLKPGSRIVINYMHGGAAREATLTVGTKLM
jgi:PDZ domain-containing protein